MTVPVCPLDLWHQVVKELARSILETERLGMLLQTGKALEQAQPPRPAAIFGSTYTRTVPGCGQQDGAA